MPYRNRELQRAMGKIHAGKYIEPVPPPRFRVSSLPFCPLLFVINQATGKHGEFFREIPFESGFYFKLGHAIHDLYQVTARHSLPNKFIGNWHCTRVLSQENRGKVIISRKCGQTALFCSLQQATRAGCPHGKTDCELYFNYQELQVRGVDITGHTDFLYRGKRRRHYSLVDVKTTSSFLFDNPKRAIDLGYYPSQKYLIQVFTYALLLEQQYHIVIDDVSIAYQAREKATAIGRNKNPANKLFSYRVTDKLRRRYRRDLARYQRRFAVAAQWLQAQQHGKLTNKLTDQLYAARPCHSARDYLAEMRVGFIDKSPCQFHNDAACYTGRMRKNLGKLASGQPVEQVFAPEQ